ncbi:UNVERIFIED_CONTAM: hypothetical protein FKN15_014530 [Acipenser sinensis]
MKCLREKGQGPRIDQYFLRSQSSQSNEIQRQEANHSSQDISTPVIDVRRTCMDTVSDEPNDPCEPGHTEETSHPRLYRALCVPHTCTALFSITLWREVAASSPHGSVPREIRRHTRESNKCRKPSSRFSASSSASPSPPPRKKKSRRCFKRSADSEQMEKLWAAVSDQGTVLTELLHECLAQPAPPVPFGTKGATSTDWQQDAVLSITASEEVDEQELAPVAPVVLLLIKRATAVLQVPWTTEDRPRAPSQGAIWRQCITDIWVLITLESGYSLQFKHGPLPFGA